MEKRDTVRTFQVVAAGMILIGVFIWLALRFPATFADPEVPSDFPFLNAQDKPKAIHPAIELLKLVVAAVVGITVTAVHKLGQRDKPLARSLEQAQILLCVAGALMMIIIGSSVPRALGIAGAAGLIRFRTPIKDPKDSIVLILLLGLGMACGRGAFTVAGGGAIFACVFLVVLNAFGDAKPKSMMLEVISTGREFPAAHLQTVLAKYKMVIEPREVTQGDNTVMKYQVTVPPTAPLEDISSQLMAEGKAGIKSVVWQAVKKQ